VYRICLIHELRKVGLRVVAEQIVPIFYDDLYFEQAYRLDVLIEDELIVEVKAVERLLPVHVAQLLSYLKLMDKRLGLLLNFNARRLVQGLRRVVNNF